MYGKTPKEYLSLWSVIALGIGSMVGAGIFALMGQATLMAGKNVYWSFFLGGVAALLSGYTYAKLGSLSRFRRNYGLFQRSFFP